MVWRPEKRSTAGFVAAALCGVLAIASGCKAKVEHTEVELSGGDPGRGKAMIRTYGCGACHVIPGIPGAAGRVGPTLFGVATRSYIAGILPNTPKNMIRWIETPREIDPRKAMPDMNITESDARDIAAYLYTLGTTTPIRQ